MNLTEQARHFIRKHYPRDHLYIAGALTVLVALLLMFPESDQMPVDPVQASIPSPVPLGQAAAYSELNLSDYVVDSSSEPVITDITVWKNIQVESGDSLSAIFTKVGLSNQDLFRVLNSSDEAKILNRIYPGYQLDFMIPDQGQLEALRVFKSPLEGSISSRGNRSSDAPTRSRPFI